MGGISIFTLHGYDLYEVFYRLAAAIVSRPYNRLLPHRKYNDILCSKLLARSDRDSLASTLFSSSFGSCRMFLRKARTLLRTTCQWTVTTFGNNGAFRRSIRAFDGLVGLVRAHFLLRQRPTLRRKRQQEAADDEEGERGDAGLDHGMLRTGGLGDDHFPTTIGIRRYGSFGSRVETLATGNEPTSSINRGST